MKRKIGKLVSLTVAVMIATTNVAFAKGEAPRNAVIVSENGSAIEPRSLYLASAISEITNEGQGVLRIYADFASYNDVNWAKITINLQRRKGTSGSWSPVDTYEYEFTPEDTSDGRLHSEMVEFRVYGLETDYYYRLKCEHKVQTPSGSYETKNTQTNGVLLTSYPVYRTADEVK